MAHIPYLKEQNGTKVLMVHDAPYICLGGEVGNSNSSSVEYMEGVWDKAQELAMNTLLMPVTWELFEPVEGHFDYTLVDGLIEQARRRGGKIIFLWFGAWKNAQCYYAPEWVKTDLKRFRRAEVKKGKNYVINEKFGSIYTTMSYLCEETKTADARAFRTLMAHIRSIDEEENTVIAVQVENETGLMGAAREHSDEADALFYGPVPQDFADYMRSHTDTMTEAMKEAVESGSAAGSWEEVFGAQAEEIFSAYYVSSYVNAIAAAGKEEYPLPMTANCWLDKGDEAGVFPTGGPVSRVAEVWQFCAPNIDIMTPDIYVQNFLEICDEYTRRGTPLFIPETATHSHAAPREVYCIGHYHAMCYSPFGFEKIGKPFDVMQGYLFGMDTTDPLLQEPQDPEIYRQVTDTLKNMMPLLVEKYGTDDLQAFIAERPEENTLLFGKYGFRIMVTPPIISRKDGYCLILKESEDTFYAMVNQVILSPFSADPEKKGLDFLVLEDGHFENGTWIRNRRLNGDEVAIQNYTEPTVLRIRLFAYE
ncbi:MAG: DUF5597 domain-containing protein [Lachnospiraceae bacterium]|nr:DUF5597 domain-containing protein [Lachnospiraceae bacterium]